MINEREHWYVEKTPIRVIVQITEENFDEVVEWIGAERVRVETDEDDGRRWIYFREWDDMEAVVGDRVVRQGSYWSVISEESWNGEYDEEHPVREDYVIY